MTTLMRQKLGISILLFSLIIPCFVHAQLDTATVTGIVTDSTGASIPGADVTITNANTNVTFKGVSNRDGLYSIRNLSVGDYIITITHQGYKAYSVPGLHLVAAQILQVNAALPVGSVSETVSVSNIPQLLETETSTVDTTVESKDIETIPLNARGGRDASNIQYAIVPTMSGYFYQDSIAGSTSFSKSVLIDGIDATSATQGVILTQGADSIAEMQVQIGGIDIDSAATGGGAILYETKSGTNVLHGSAFYYTQNEDLDANTWTNNYFQSQCSSSSDVAKCRSQYSRAKNRFQDYGVSLGAPIWKNHTFIFGDWEKYSQVNNNLNPQGATVPTAAMLAGDFSALLTQGTYQGTINDPTSHQPIINPCTGQPYLYGQIFDPATATTVNGVPCGTPFSGNIIPTSRFSSLSKGLISVYQKYYAPTLPTITNNFPTNSGAPQIRYNFDLRVDHKLTARQNLMFGYTYVHNTAEGSAGAGLQNYSSGGPFGNWYQQSIHSENFRFNHSFTITPNLVNSASVSYVKLFADEAPFTKANPVDYGFTNSNSLNFPNISFGGSNGITESGTGTRVADHYHQNDFHYQDTVSWLKGKHTFKVGGEFSAMQNNSAFGGIQTYNFASNIGGPIDSRVTGFVGSGFAAMLLGDVSNASIPPVDLSYGRRKSFDVFGSDTWKVSPRLVASLGIRWDVTTPYHDAAGKWQEFSPVVSNPSGVWGNYPGAWQFTSSSSSTFETNNNFTQFGPHVGAAYQLRNTLAIRGGYGLSYVPQNLNDNWGSGPYQLNSFWYGVNAVVNNVSGSTAYNWDSGYPGKPIIYDRTSSQSYLYGSVNYVDPNALRLGFTQNYTGGMEWEAAKNVLLSVGYLGNKGSRLHDGSLQAYRNYPSWDTYSSLLASGKINAVVSNAGQAAAAGVPYPYPGFRGYAWAAIAPYPQVASVGGTINYSSSPVGVSAFNALIVEAKTRNAHGVSMDMSYTLSRSTGNVEGLNNFVGGGNYGFQNLQEYSEAKGWLLGIDRTHVVKGYINYELPFGANQRWASTSRLINKLIGNWTIGALALYETGGPIKGIAASNYGTPYWMGTIRSNVASGFRFVNKPTGKLNLNNLGDPSNRAFDKTAFTDPQIGEFGNCPYIGIGRAPAYNNTDMSLSKSVTFGPEGRFAFRLHADFFDAFNQHHLNAPDTGRNDKYFGQVIGVTGTHRVGQLSGRFTW